MNILLLEAKTKGRTHRTNLALARYYTLYNKPENKIIYGLLDRRYRLPKGFVPDLIIASTIFSWDVSKLVDFILKIKTVVNPQVKIMIGGIAATFMKDWIKEKLRVEPFSGCNKKLDHVIPAKEVFVEDNTYFFSSRSCPQQCSFCAVKDLEPESYIIENWKEQIHLNKKNVICMDNNILATDIEHQKNVFSYLTEIAHKDGVRVTGSRKLRTVELDGGFDWRLINVENMHMVKDIKFSKIRVAWDNVKYEKGFDHAMKLLLKTFPHKSKRGKHENIECYVLYNYEKDCLEDTLYRVYKLWYHYGIFPYLMRYQPLNSLEYKKYVSPNWNETDVIDVARWVNSRRTFSAIPKFEYYFGRSGDGKSKSFLSDTDKHILHKISVDSNPAIDLSKTFNENLGTLKEELKRRDEFILRTQQLSFQI